jgi:hypothetical protein
MLNPKCAGVKRPLSEETSVPEQAKRVKLQDGGEELESAPAATLASHAAEGTTLTHNEGRCSQWK